MKASLLPKYHHHCRCNNGFGSHLVTCKFYQGESKVLQYFGNVRHNLAASDAFSKL